MKLKSLDFLQNGKSRIWISYLNSYHLTKRSEVTFKLKDGSEKSFSICGSVLNIDGKQYKCHSYLTNYITRYGIEE